MLEDGNLNAEGFAQFFQTKVEQIRDTFDDTISPTRGDRNLSDNLRSFTPMAEEEMRKIIL